MSQFFSHSTAPRPSEPPLRAAPSDPPFPPPKVARNSATRKFNTAHKRCNPNGLVSKFERFTWNYVRHFRATTPTPGRHPPGPPFTTPPQKSHVIRLPENSTPPTNVAIPTIWFQSLKGLHGITCDISGQPRLTVPTHARTRQHANAAPHHRTSGRPPPRPGLVASTRHRAPASSRASTHTPAQ